MTRVPLDQRLQDVQTRRAVPDDAAEVVRIFRAGFPPSLLPYTIYDQPGIVDYLRGMLRWQHVGTTSVTIVSTYQGKVAAWAQFHRHPTLLFLNHVYVTPEFQGAGLGRVLLRGAIDLVREPGQIYLGSEAFSTNKGAHAWYRSLGMEPSDRVHWVELIPEPVQGRRAWWSFDGLVTGLAAQKRFGFSRILLRTRRTAYVIRTLGRHFYRGNSFDILDDASAMTALHTLDPKRKLMIIASGEGREPRYPIVAQSTQVRGRIDTALTVLGSFPG